MGNPGEDDGSGSGGLGGVALIERFSLLALFALLLIGVYLVLRPFLLGLVFGGILAIATWPLRLWLVNRGLAPLLAGLLILLTIVLFVVVPVMLVAPGLADELRDLTRLAEAWLASSPPVPAWLAGLPLVGGSLAAGWQGLIAQSSDSHAMLLQYAAPAREFLLAIAEGLASSALLLVIALVMATGFWARGDRMVEILTAGLSALGGRQLAGLTGVAASAVRGVFYGIVGTAVIQGLLMSAGLMLAGIPAAATLGFLTLILALSQFGSFLINLIWAGSAWYLYSRSGLDFTVWFVVAWGLFVTYLETFLKPMLIGARMRLPMMLVILGVFGGFLSFGFLGLFIGPTLLAVAYEILAAWRALAPGAAAPARGNR